MVTFGIDFGTTNSVAAMNDSGLITIIPDENGQSIIPSLVAVNKKGQVITGYHALCRIPSKDTHIIFSIKKALGTPQKIKIHGKTFTPVDISSFILKHIKKQIEVYVGHQVKNIVITSPAYFSINQRMALNKACWQAGFHVTDMINEPTSAALAYGIDKGIDQNIVVYDLGGGTFDVSVIHNKNNKFQVLSVAGDNHLGGDDFDFQIVGVLTKRILKEFQLDILKNPAWVYPIKEMCEKVKIELSRKKKASLDLSSLSIRSLEKYHFDLDRIEFNRLIYPLIKRTISLMNQAILDATVHPQQIDKVLLVGGSTYIPLVRELIYQYFQKEIYIGLNPNECVAKGAAIHSSHQKTEQKPDLKDIIPRSLGIEAEGGIFVPIIKKNSPVPICSAKIFAPMDRSQKTVEIKIYQGERIKASQNIFLGKLILEGFKTDQEECPKIEVRFQIDEKGLIHVKAMEKVTGKSVETEFRSVYDPSVKEGDKQDNPFDKRNLIHQFYLKRNIRSLLKQIDRMPLWAKQDRLIFKRALKTLLKNKEFSKIEYLLNTLSSDQENKKQVYQEILGNYWLKT
ncbi:MAG: Hsp70 family protein [Spirochaetes bacterium]|nr:Hsp70 family protein [Spirochaetota bacterium]